MTKTLHDAMNLQGGTGAQPHLHSRLPQNALAPMAKQASHYSLLQLRRLSHHWIAIASSTLQSCTC